MGPADGGGEVELDKYNKTSLTSITTYHVRFYEP